MDTNPVTLPCSLARAGKKVWLCARLASFLGSPPFQFNAGAGRRGTHCCAVGELPPDIPGAPSLPPDSSVFVTLDFAPSDRQFVEEIPIMMGRMFLCDF